jgi:hypothetical protein
LLFFDSGAKLGYEGQDGVGTSVLLLMVRDAYANYVVQTAIDVVPEGKEKRMLLEELKVHEVQLVSVTTVLSFRSSSPLLIFFPNHFLWSHPIELPNNSETTHLPSILLQSLARSNVFGFRCETESFARGEIAVLKHYHSERNWIYIFAQMSLFCMMCSELMNKMYVEYSVGRGGTSFSLESDFASLSSRRDLCPIKYLHTPNN